MADCVGSSTFYACYIKNRLLLKTGRVTVGVLNRKIAVRFLACNKNRKFNSCRPDLCLNTSTNQNFTENAILLYDIEQLLPAVYVNNRRLFIGKQ
jgi:hypothetical protein